MRLKSNVITAPDFVLNVLKHQANALPAPQVLLMPPSILVLVAVTLAISKMTRLVKVARGYVKNVLSQQLTVRNAILEVLTRQFLEIHARVMLDILWTQGLARNATHYALHVLGPQRIVANALIQQEVGMPPIVISSAFVAQGTSITE